MLIYQNSLWIACHVTFFAYQVLPVNLQCHIESTEQFNHVNLTEFLGSGYIF